MGKLKNTAIFYSQEKYEKNAQPNLQRWLTTSSPVISIE